MNAYGKPNQILKIPITETPHELTNDIDIVDSIGFVRLMRQVDSQLFSGNPLCFVKDQFLIFFLKKKGYMHLPCVYDEEILQSIEGVVQRVKELLRNPQGLI